MCNLKTKRQRYQRDNQKPYFEEQLIEKKTTVDKTLRTHNKRFKNMNHTKHHSLTHLFWKGKPAPPVSPVVLLLQVIVTTTNGTYPLSFVIQVFRNDKQVVLGRLDQ